MHTNEGNQPMQHSNECVQLQNSVSHSGFNGFQQSWSQCLSSVCFIQNKKTLTIEQKVFVLLLIERRYFFLGHLVYAQIHPDNTLTCHLPKISNLAEKTDQFTFKDVLGWQFLTMKAAETFEYSLLTTKGTYFLKKVFG